jgi:site-specific DNA recombinase
MHQIPGQAGNAGGFMSLRIENEDRAKLVGIWIRVSTEDQARGESPEHHERRASLYAEAKGWKVREVYRLEAVSGKSVMAHPEAKRMLADIKSGHITGLIFSKLARLARNTRELLDFADIFREHGADLISLQESIDTTSPAGRLFYTMIAAMAQWEREEIAERVAVSVPIRAKLGKPLGGQAPFGYRWHERRLMPDPKEAPVRKLLYELFTEHKRKKTVARILNERGYRTRNGSPFSDTTVVRLLRDPTAKGLRRANYTMTTNSKRAWKLKPESEWVFSEVEPIVPEDLWNQCNTVLDAQLKGRTKASRKTVHLFAGLTVCSCGQKMYVPSNTPKYVCYKCRNKIAVVDLEGIFHEQLKSFLFSGAELTAYLKQADKRMKEKEELLRVLEGEHKGNASEMERLYRLYMDDGISKDAFSGKYRSLEERQKQLEEELPSLQAELDLMKIHYLSSEEIISEAKDLYSRWPSLSREEKRHIVEAITERITVGKDDIDISLNYLPSSAPSNPPNPGNKATRPHRRVAFLPFGKVTLKAPKPVPYPRVPKTLADHLKKHRYELGLRQKDVAKHLRVNEYTVLGWENGKNEPEVRYLPRIILFLGYDPLPRGTTLGDRLRAKRREQGLSRKRTAGVLKIDEATLARYEAGQSMPKGARLEAIERFLTMRPR